MLGTVYIRDINFAFQNSKNNANSVLMGWNTGAFSIDRLYCLLFAFVVFTVGLSTSFAAMLEGEAKAQGDCYLAFAGGPS